ncbi:MAG: sigma 54-interacting transcriptional regulator [Peptostreptococcus sp.]|uniref:sigma 54-interacting transcriptional regulator n=1 Tax=Peptostreptococcus TaxID=1257 RepID=UPI00233097AC|nr:MULTISPECIES: sigma 54-interacting transcriptional regulator [Peptostreptococcus]MDB8821100.1 sigma 54-interacting transcriptional regulator [Peptostreptococcus anaerobius]MDB8825578.1 sigma 54-interacting transcriptional regulator [Peptostreptococcus anaerobius]MDB8827496.1 sigma 54-interacting transcriptional regulator [Peptostreptococcus anaerobius]MDB8829313.1 sigma 54-interacting transcriptional regulator [Peptostreptococcus anaerobius]MDB8831264.1 sigma 54-interacting transcriptional 
MEDQLLRIIKNEDKKNPLTDQEIAQKLGISRSKVTSLRTSSNIASSNNRRKALIIGVMEKIMLAKADYTDRYITDILLDDGFVISRSQVRGLMKEIEAKNKDGIDYSQASDYANKIKVVKDKLDEKDGFEGLIGADGSLKEKISSLKSAMMYPPNGLNTIIHGPTGVGKSDMAECMYRFSVINGFKKKGSPFIVFNCADYAENPNLLIAHLFGVQKGAYTGADSSKEGIVERADGGILFLDEVHRLPSTGQEILFSLIDRGVYRRLGETTAERKAKVLIICATTGDPNSDLLNTFKRRIPMIIELPSLDSRPKKERYKLILKFFEIEAKRVNKNFVIAKNVINKLMNYKCSGNIGQLKSDIQVTCARAFSKIEIGEDFVFVGEDSLRSYVRKSSDKEVFSWIEDVFIDISDFKSTSTGMHKNAISEIHQYAEKELKILGHSHYSEEEIKNIFLGKLDKKFDELILDRSAAVREELKSYINGEMSEKVFEIMQKVIAMLKTQYEHINSSLYPALAIHIQHTLERIKNGKKIVNPSLSKISSSMPEEYELARYIASISENISKLSIPEDELGYLAYYINKFCIKDDKVKENVKVLIVTHGKVGIEMANVVNNLMGVECTIGLEIPLESSSSEGIEKCISQISSINAPNGLIILIDMGSLVIIGNEVEKRFKIKTKTISRVDTLLAMEIGKMAAIESKKFEDISDYCDKINKNPSDENKDQYIEKEEREKVVISLCLSGHGNAKNLKQLLDSSISTRGLDINVIPVGFLDEIGVENRLEEIEKTKKIVCIVGTIGINYKNIPYINYRKVLSGYGIEEVVNLCCQEDDDLKLSETSEGRLSDIILEEFIYENFEGISKEYVIDSMVARLQEKGYVDSRFILSVYKRESMGTLVFKSKVAIPHGLPENVKKPVISIAKLSKPIVWDNEFMVDCVALIAIKENNQAEMKKLFKILGDDDKIEQISKATSKKEIMDIFVD